MLWFGVHHSVTPFLAKPFFAPRDKVCVTGISNKHRVTVNEVLEPAKILLSFQLPPYSPPCIFFSSSNFLFCSRVNLLPFFFRMFKHECETSRVTMLQNLIPFQVEKFSCHPESLTSSRNKLCSEVVNAPTSAKLQPSVAPSGVTYSY